MSAPDEALQFARLTKLTTDEWLSRVRQGKYTQAQLRTTAHYRAHVALMEAAKVSPPPAPSPVRDPRSQYVLFAAQEPEKALAAPAKYAVALSADPAYRDASVAAIPKLRAAGHRVAGWCDCRADGTPAVDGLSFVQAAGLDYFIGQAESAAEFDDAYYHGARVIIGNRSSLRGDQTAHLSTDVAFIQEDYWNEGWARDMSPDIAAYCAGIYPTAIWNPTIAQYKQAGRWRPGDGAYHVAAIEDWSSLP